MKQVPGGALSNDRIQNIQDSNTAGLAFFQVTITEQERGRIPFTAVIDDDMGAAHGLVAPSSPSK